MSEHSDGGYRGQGNGGGNRRNSGGNNRGNGGNRGFKGRSNGGNRSFNGRGGQGGGRGRFSRDGDNDRQGNRRNFRDGEGRGGERRNNWRDGDGRSDRRNNWRDGDGRGERRNNWRDGDNDRRDNRRRWNDDDRNDRRGGGNGGRSGGPRRGGQGGQGGRDDRRGGGKKFQHANRGGANRAQHSGPQRSGYREERLNKRLNEPQVPADLDPRDLDPSVRQELRSLSKDNADMVAKHLIMSAMLLDEDTERALAHARAAKDRAGRVSVARETNGIAAYHAGEWKEAIAELRAARRMSGGPGMIAVLADCERGLGRPEKAIEVGREFDASELDPETRIELAIVLAGAHHDLKNNDEALVELQDVLEIADVPDVSRLRLYYAYADALEIAGRKDEAIEWFENAGELDHGEFMDVEDRLNALQNESE